MPTNYTRIDRRIQRNNFSLLFVVVVAVQNVYLIAPHYWRLHLQTTLINYMWGITYSSLICPIIKQYMYYDTYSLCLEFHLNADYFNWIPLDRSGPMCTLSLSLSLSPSVQHFLLMEELYLSALCTLINPALFTSACALHLCPSHTLSLPLSQLTLTVSVLIDLLRLQPRVQQATNSTVHVPERECVFVCVCISVCRIC